MMKIMTYDEYSYLWSPRPEQVVGPAMLSQFEDKGFVAQRKLNGTCNIIAVSPMKEIVVRTRHNEPHKLWTPKPECMTRFTDLPGRGWYVFVAELLHSKVSGIRDVNYIHDVLVNDGDYLVGRTQRERQDMLDDIFVDGTEEETDSHLVLDPWTWLVIEHESGFRNLFDSLTGDLDEGLVLKNPNTPLAFCTNQKANTRDLYKCRRPHKNYTA